MTPESIHAVEAVDATIAAPVLGYPIVNTVQVALVVKPSLESVVTVAAPPIPVSVDCL